MFISNSRRGYLRNGEQYASGLFLMVFCNSLAPNLPNGCKPLRALVRKVALHQCGHFMMGHVTLMGHRFSLSGTYGSNGLPIEVTEYKATSRDSWGYGTNWCDIEKVPGLWERLHPLPDELVATFWKGGGHNSAGAEGNMMFMWGCAHQQKLRHLLPAKGR